MFPMFPRTGFPTMLRRQGCDGAATMLRLCCDDALPTHPLGPSKPARCVQPARPSAVAGCVQRRSRGSRRCSRCSPERGSQRCSDDRAATMFRQQGCDGAATGLRRCRTNASGCSPDDAPATAPERTTGTHRSPRNAPSWSSSWPGATSRHVHPPAAAGCVQLPGSPAMFPRRCWTFPTMVPAMVSAIGNVPERPPVPAARLSGCHSLPGHQARPDSPRSSQVRRWLLQARQDTQTELGQDFRHGCLESERCKHLSGLPGAARTSIAEK